MAIGVSQRCDGRIGFHARALVGMGTRRAEVADVMAMCVYMGGCPALMDAADALRAMIGLPTKPPERGASGAMGCCLLHIKKRAADGDRRLLRSTEVPLVTRRRTQRGC
ncbi:carboxymuconolactone decarboxylase family protein [Sphingomonas sp. TDK1]|uniref:carboxymuconolactone decarboxylase family protein n=1 Tax=Sphingomonas sp. TDK1 TaxID=453247 RepID=UPI003FA68ACA